MNNNTEFGIVLASLAGIALGLSYNRSRLLREQSRTNSLSTAQEYYTKSAFRERVVANNNNNKFNIWDSMLVFMTCPFGTATPPLDEGSFATMTKLLFSSVEEINIYTNTLIKNLAPKKEELWLDSHKTSSGEELYQHMWEAEWLLATLKELSLIDAKLHSENPQLTDEEKEVVHYFFYGRAAPLVRKNHRLVITKQDKKETTMLVKRVRSVMDTFQSMPKRLDGTSN